MDRSTGDKTTELRVLLVGRGESDAALAKNALAAGDFGALLLDPVVGYGAGIEAYQRRRHDVCLVDEKLGDESGLGFVREAKAINLRTPIILLTQATNPGLEAAARRAGVADCLARDSIDAPLLQRTIRYAIDQSLSEAKLRDTKEELLKQLFDAQNARERAEQRGAEYIQIAEDLAQTRDELSGALQRAEESESQFRMLAQHDPLTGLANRSLFRQRLNEAIRQSRRTQHIFGVLLLDLDRFKEVNDAFGHPVGDALLREVSERLGSCVRETDTVARLSGDEFAIIGTNFSHESGAAMLVAKIIDSLAKPVRLDGREVVTAASVGIAIQTDQSQGPDELMNQADLALYQAKNDGRGHYCYFDNEMMDRERRRKAIESELRTAIEREELVVHYQPKVEGSTGVIVGAEALVRWHDPERGPISPIEFIPIAEATGLIVPLGQLVLRQVCAQVAAWRSAGLLPPPIAVNTSAIEFKRPELFETVSTAIRNADIDPNLLELEITEGVVMDEVESRIELLRQLRDFGVKIAIDDFGTGYSSLSYLARFPVDRLKIDRSFVQDILSDPTQAAIAKTIISLGKVSTLTSSQKVSRPRSSSGCSRVWAVMNFRAITFPCPSAPMCSQPRAKTSKLEGSSQCPLVRRRSTVCPRASESRRSGRGRIKAWCRLRAGAGGNIRRSVRNPVDDGAEGRPVAWIEAPTT